MNGISLFTGAGIGEHFFKEIGINIVVANELLADRANLYSKLYPDTKMICGDILDEKIFNNVVANSGNNVEFLIATPPCQGLSVAGKNRDQARMIEDKRNHLVFRILDFINIIKPKYILLENVSNFLKIKYHFNNEFLNIVQILHNLYSNEYVIENKIVNTSDYGVPQKRLRAIIKMYKKELKWDWPEVEEPVTVKEAIGHLPSLESNQKSDIYWHFARKHSDNHILWMKHTPTGKSAFENKVHYPKNQLGEKVKSYITTYRRMKWDEPAPTITMRNDAISSQMNVHPGRKLADNTYSDSRVLSVQELILLSSLPQDWNVPRNTPERLIRHCIGEGVPPLLLKKIILGIKDL